MSKDTSINSDEENMENVDLSDNIIEEEKKVFKKKEEVKTSAPKNNKDNSEYIAVNTLILLNKMEKDLKKYEETLNIENTNTKIFYNKNVRNNRKDTIIKLKEIIKLKDINTKCQLANSLELLLSLKNDLIEVKEQIIFDVVHTCNPFKDSRVSKIAGKAIKEIDEIEKKVLGVNILKNEKISLLKKTKNIEIELDNIKGQYGSLVDRHKSLLNIIDEHTTTIINQKKIEIEKTLYEEINITKKDLESYKNESLEFQKKYDLTYKENEENKKTIIKVIEENKIIKDGSKLFQENEIIKIDNTRLKDKISKKEEENQKLQEEELRLKNKVITIGQDNVKAFNEIESYKETIKNQDNTIENLKEEKKLLNGKIIILEENDKKKDIEIINLKKENKELKDDIIILKEENKELKDDNLKLNIRIGNTEQSFLNALSEMNKKIEKLEESSKNKGMKNKKNKNKSFVKEVEESRENNNKDKDMGKN
jgi:hypothetical protein